MIEPVTIARATSTFPAEATEVSLRKAMKALEADAAAVRDLWDPAFDSLAVVNILCCLDEVLPGLTVAPEKIVRRGGYKSLDEGVQHILGGVEQAWRKKNS